MGMSASQARLLSITARLSDNEQSGQSVSYSKQRLADQTDQIQAEYNAALNATKLTVLTGFSGAQPQYSDMCYSLITGYNMSVDNKQYLVTDSTGKILVAKNIADAFVTAQGDFNRFVEKAAGISQANVAQSESPDIKKQAIHEAWDKYLKSVNMGVETKLNDQTQLYEPTAITTVSEDAEHFNTGLAEGFSVSWVPTDDGHGYATVGDMPINYNGTSPEQRDLYDYAVSLTKYLETGSALKTSSDSPDVKSQIAYYKNMFNEMTTCGFYTYGVAPIDSDAPKGSYKSAPLENGKYISPLEDKNASLFEKMIRDGQLQIKFYSATERKFLGTTISEDQAIQEVKDDRKIALAEAKYEEEMVALERKDKRFDLELKKLDTEHNALQTEYESVKGVIDKNVEKTFSIFS